MTVHQRNLTVQDRDLHKDLDQVNDLVHDLDQLRSSYHALDLQNVVRLQTKSLSNKKLELQQRNFLRIIIDQGHSNSVTTKTLKVCSGIQSSN